MELSELQMRVLSELEEAGHENFPTLANTVMLVSGDEREQAEFGMALKELVRSDLVRIARSTGSSEELIDLSVEDSLSVLERLSNHLLYKESEKHWTGGERPWPEVATTAAGREKAFEILDERGYQWWRRDK